VRADRAPQRLAGGGLAVSADTEVSVYDRMCWPEGELERALAGGAHRRELEAYFGHGEYALLATLARRAARAHDLARRRGRPSARRPRLYLLPGLLGSQLGRPRSASQPPDLLWLDPADIVDGRLSELRWPRHATRARALRPLGIIVYVYLPLKLRLEAAGFDVVLYAYDWREDLWSCGRTLAAALAADPAAELALVGHSMGGLLARAALAQTEGATARRIRRIVTLGTPHGGAIGAVQALRATYPALLRLAAIDRNNDAATLARVFASFQSVYQLLPAPVGPLDLFDPTAWPRRGAQPDAALLAQAHDFRSRLAPGDARYVSIIGTGQRTVTALEQRGGQFRYEITAAGDGTVASASAALDGARHYSLPCEHSELPRSERIAAALCELMVRGSTRRLRAAVSSRPGRRAYVSDAALLRSLGRKLDWYRLSIGERRRYLNQLNAPPPSYRPPRTR
jgi:pimeloyl-ACP methyl ester carboxylesterase